MWIYFRDERTESRIHTDTDLDYKYNEDCDTHLITFKGGNIAFTKDEIKHLKKLLKEVRV